MTSTDAALLTQLLQGVVTGGTGTAAALPDRPVAGKTGTTENYGDAWFVGYTPQLVTAVWVGYPKGLRPMLSEYHGSPVAGGTFPAQIWKSFMQPALKLLGAQPESFPAPPYLSASAKRVTYRDGRIELDNGRCRDVSLLVYFTGRGPATTANCKVNEVDVPNVIGLRLDAARVRLEAQPLTPQVIYSPAKAGQRLNVVLRQFPKAGTLSSFGHVTLVLAKPLHGTRAEGHRARLEEGESEAAAAEAQGRAALGAREARTRARAVPAGGRGRSARHEGDRHGRKGRLRNGEPSRP